MDVSAPLTTPARPVAICELSSQELSAAAAVLGRGMRDNPLHLRVFGDDPPAREAALTRLFDALLRRHLTTDAAVVLGAFVDGTLVGVCAMVRPGRCQPRFADKLRLLPSLLGSGGMALTLRVIDWTSQWSKRDPDTGHWHLGPVGVDRALQGQGIGSRLLTEFCARMDALPSASYLETDKPENVVFYEKFGFQVIGDAAVMGVPNWFMVRTP